MSSKTFAITLDGVEYRVTAREIVDISTIVTGITPSTAEYTGSAITVTPVSEQALVENTDYTITYSDNVSIGTCVVTINGIGNYSGTVTYNLQITGTNIATLISGISPDSAVYTGSPITVNIISDAILIEGVDYTITYSDNISVGTCVVAITGIGSYSGSTEYTLDITKADISTVITGISPDTAVYTGSEITVSPVSGTTLVQNTDYIVAYSDNVSAGICNVTFTGIGNYGGTAQYTLEITEANISSVISGIEPTTATYTGETITVDIVSDAILVEDTDYMIDYSDNISVGNCTVTIVGAGNYTGSLEYTLEITGIDISSVVTGIDPTTAEYTGEAITVKINSEEALEEDTDYIVTYSDNVSVGNCTVTVTGEGNYTGTAEFILTITGSESEEESVDDNTEEEPSEDTESDDSTEENPEEEPEEEEES